MHKYYFIQLMDISGMYVLDQ